MNSRNGGASPQIQRLELILGVALPKLMRSADRTTNLIQQTREDINSFDYPTRVRALFRNWAPLYDAYWNLTNHHLATEQCFRQLNAAGRYEEEKMFRGRGLDLGTGTGLIPFEIGRLKEREVLDDIRDERPDSATSQKFQGIAAECRRLQRVVERFLATSDPSCLDSSLSSWFMRRLAQDFMRDCSRYPIIIELTQYRMLRQKLADSEKLGALFQNHNLRDLVFAYVQDAILVNRLLDQVESHSKKEKAAFLQAFRERLGKTASITGVDLCPEMLDIARRKCGVIFGGYARAGMFIEANVSALPPEITETKFDFITISQLVHLLPDECKRALIHLCAQVLTENGKLIIVDEWNPTFVGNSLISFQSQGNMPQDSKLWMLLTTIELLFDSVFYPIDKGKMREIVHNEGFVYSGVRTSHPIGVSDETSHREFAHVFVRRKDDVQPQAGQVGNAESLLEHAQGQCP